MLVIRNIFRIRGHERTGVTSKSGGIRNVADAVAIRIGSRVGVVIIAHISAAGNIIIYVVHRTGCTEG